MYDKNTKMNKETLRMQMLAGIITESQYKAKLEESKKDSLNEHYVAGGIVGIGAINQIPPRAKTDYEMAFEHFLGKKYSLNESEETEAAKEIADEIKDVLSPEEIEFLKQTYSKGGKEVVAKAIEKTVKEGLSEAEPPSQGEFGMSQNEIKLRQIIDKIIKGGALAAAAGIIPAAIAASPAVAIGLGIAALTGVIAKDAAWWKKGSHQYKAQDKYGVKETVNENPD